MSDSKTMYQQISIHILCEALPPTLEKNFMIRWYLFLAFCLVSVWSSCGIQVLGSLSYRYIWIDIYMRCMVVHAMYRDTNCFKFGLGSLTNTNIYVFSVTINSRRFFFAIEPQKFAPHSVAQKKRWSWFGMRHDFFSQFSGGLHILKVTSSVSM